MNVVVLSWCRDQKWHQEGLRCFMSLTTLSSLFQAMLGIFFSAKSAVLIEDVPFTEEDIRNEWVASNHTKTTVEARFRPDGVNNVHLRDQTQTLQTFYASTTVNSASGPSEIWFLLNLSTKQTSHHSAELIHAFQVFY